MKQLMVAIILGCEFLTAVLAGQSVDKSLDVEKNVTVKISVVRGEVTLKGVDDTQVSVKGRLDDNTKNFVFEKKDDQVLIRVELEKNSRWGEGSHLTINVPEGSKVEFKGVATHFDASNIHQGMFVNTVSGDLNINKVNDKLYVNTVSGDVEVAQVKGVLEVASVSGEITLKDSDISIAQVKTVSGDASLDLGKAEQVKISSVSGDVMLNGLLSGEKHSSVSSVSGDIELRLDKNSDTKLLLNTGPGGTIKNSFNGALPSRTRAHENSLELVLGKGSSKLKGNTISGTLKLSALH